MPRYNPPFEAKTDDPISSKVLYGERAYYRDTTKQIFDTINPNYIDLWYETPLYGKVNPAGVFVYPDNRKIIYPIITDTLGNPSIVGFDFAMRALEDYVFFLRRGFTTGRTGLNRLLNNFSFVSGYVDPFEEYRKYLANVLNIFNIYIVQSGRNSKIVNFDTFVCELLFALEVVGENLTFFNYYTSSKANLSSTGLSFRFIEADQDDDYLKNRFFKHPEFYKYVNSAANFGFRINKNSPWEIIIDVNSKPMLQDRKIKRKRRQFTAAGKKSQVATVAGYLQGNFITSPEHFFDSYYLNAMRESFKYFKKLLVFSYDDYVERMRYVSDYGDSYIAINPIQNFSDTISNKEFGRIRKNPKMLKPYKDEDYNRFYFIKKYERILSIEFNNKMNKTKYRSFKSNFDKAIENQSYSKAYRLLDIFYQDISKIYDPDSEKLIWDSPKKSLTNVNDYGMIQTKDQPTIGKIVTEFIPDI